MASGLFRVAEWERISGPGVYIPGYYYCDENQSEGLIVSDDNVVDFDSARSRLAPERKEKAAKQVRKQVQSAMGWNSWPKTKKGKGAGSKGPSPNRGKKR